MENDTDAMRTVGTYVTAVGTSMEIDVDDGETAISAAGEGNDGFVTVAKAATAATEWLAHIRSIASNMSGAGDDITTAANDFDGVDADNGADIASVDPSLQLQ